MNDKLNITLKNMVLKKNNKTKQNKNKNYVSFNIFNIVSIDFTPNKTGTSEAEIYFIMVLYFKT